MLQPQTRNALKITHFGPLCPTSRVSYATVQMSVKQLFFEGLEPEWLVESTDNGGRAPMRAVIQRVTSGRVTVAGSIVGSIGQGLVVLLGVGSADTEAEAKIL